MIKFKNFLNNLEYYYGWLRVINSPFVRLKWEIKWYKKPTVGTPYFLPRRKQKNKNKPGYLEYVPIKYFGKSYWSLGWKSKWSDTDIRFEWEPGLSLVLFGTQLVIYPVPDCDWEVIFAFWEAWVVYDKYTDKSKSMEDRLRQCMELYSCIWIRGKDERINYYNYILKNKYKYLIKDKNKV
jgi:hypothetical protein